MMATERRRESFRCAALWLTQQEQELKHAWRRPKPQTLNLQSSTLNPQSWTLNPQTIHLEP